MSADLRVVLDTNVIVSAMLRKRSVPRQVYNLSLSKGHLLVSEATLHEISEVLQRPKLLRYVTVAQRVEFLAALVREAEVVTVLETIRACRDPRDDKFLELSVSGGAMHLISGDEHLLALHPFRDVSIVAPQRFLELFQDANGAV